MPRIAVDGGSAALLGNDLNVAKVVQNLDLEKTFGASAEFAETLQKMSTTGEESWCFFLCFCCLMLGEDQGTGKIIRLQEAQREMRERKSSLAEAPQQHSMDMDPNPPKPRGRGFQGFQSLLQLLSSSEDFQRLMQSEDVTKREKLGYFLFGSKFGHAEADQLKQCVEQLKAVGPQMIQKDEPDIQELQKQVEQKDLKAFQKFLRLVGGATVLKHGAAVAAKGLDALELGQCGQVLCAGDLTYELDDTGLHKCTWNCPENEIPDKFQVISADHRGSEKQLNMTLQDLENTGKRFEDDAETDPEHFEKSKISKLVSKMKFKFHKAFSDDPLKLFQMKAVDDIGSKYPTAMRYHGTCRSKDLEVAERVLFTGQDVAIPRGAVVKVMRLPGFKTPLQWFKTALQTDEVEVKYLGQGVIVKRSELKRQNLASVKLDSDLQEWMKSTGDTLEVDLKQPGHKDPSRRQSKDTFWFSLESPKPKDD